MVISGAVVVAYAARFKPSNLISISLVVVGAAIGAVAAVNNILPLLVLLLVVGLAMTPLQSAVATLVQLLVSDEMRGRVGGALNSLISAATVLSMGLAGVAAAALSVRGVFLGAGLLCSVAGLVAWMLFRGTEADEKREPESAAVAT